MSSKCSAHAATVVGHTACEGKALSAFVKPPWGADLAMSGAAPLESDAVTASGRAVGSVRSTLVLDDRLLGLSPIRREVGLGEEVEAGGRAAKVVGLPFAAEDLDG